MIVYLPLLLCLLRMSIVDGQSDAKILKSSLTFVIDDTSSMEDDIKQVLSGANSIFDTVMNSNASQIENFIIITFNDPSSRVVVNTKSRDEFKEKLNSIKVHGGDDCPEFAMSGIKLALEESLRGSLIFVFTDASAKDYMQYSEVKSLATKMQSKVVFVLTGTCKGDEKIRSADYQVYYDLAKVTLGQVFHLEKQEIEQILEYVKYIIKDDKNVISIESFPPGYENTLNFTVDAKQKDVAIAVSGNDPKISIKGPDGSTPKSKDLMKTSKIAIIQLLERKPGLFSAKLGSKSNTDVVVTAATTFNFKHGFSFFTPSSIHETTTKPVPDTTPYLSIKLLGDDDIKLQIVKIVDIDENVIREMRLEIANDKEKFYLTEPFQPPNSLFRISVTGYDTESKETITRTGPPVEPQSNDVPGKSKIPTITIEGGPKINTAFNKPLQLKCKVNGFPTPEIIWAEKDTGAVLSTNVSIIEIGSDYINVLNIDKVVKNSTYQCTAKNSLGQNIESVSVESELRNYFDVLEVPQDTTIEFQKEGKLTCKVDAFPPTMVSWFLNAVQISKDENLNVSDDGSILIIKNMQPQFAGNIMCEVRNKFNAKKMYTRLRISGLDFPDIDKSKTDLHFIKGSNGIVDCKIIEGKPRPNVQWYFKHELDKKFYSLPNTEESLNLTNVDSTQAGTYKCKITNIMGEDIHKINVFVEYAPIIEDHEAKIVSNAGQLVTLKCVVDGVPAPNVAWYKDEEKINNTDKYRISKDNQLEINVTSRDTGKYVCRADNKIGTTESSTEVDVQVKPTIEKSMSIIHARKGSGASINCTLIEGNPNVTMLWRFKQKGRKNFRSLRQLTNEHHITIHDVKTSHSGIYKCLAKNTLGKDHHEIELSVEYPPEIKKYIDKINVKEGDDERLHCRVDGIPVPKIEWFKDGEIINNPKLFKIYSDHSIRHKFSLEDAGNYTCIAKNKIGTAAISIIVDVFVPVSIILPSESTINSTVGDNISLECQARGYPPPEIKWIFYSLDSNVPQKIIIPETSSSVLTLQNIESTDRGFYTCVVSNSASSANTTYELIVFSPPEITNIPEKNVFNAVDRDLVLRIPCNATGYPKPTITWMKDELNIATGTDWYDIDNDGTLIIKNVDEISAGIYVCQAENFLSTDIEVFEVIVDPFPEELSPLSKTIIEKGTSASIECPMPHEKIDSLRWYKDRNHIKTGELIIENATIANAGIYVCQVSNFRNSNSSSIQVEIGFRPEFTEEKSSEETNIVLEEGMLALLSCNAIGVPQPKVSWWHDDKEINATDYMQHAFQMQYKDRGNYYCNISNEFGNISRTFVITSKDCFLKIDQDFPVNQPLILPSLKWLTYDTIDGYLRIPKGDYVALSCPKKFSNFAKRNILAFCEEKTNFKVSGKIYKYSDFECTEEIKPFAKQTGQCLSGSANTENIIVGYEVAGVTIQVYEICLDKDKNTPIYGKHKIQRSLANEDLIESEWLNSELLPLDFASLYDCKRQKNTISSVLGRWFHRYDNCCFSKRQLVNPRDMIPGLAQKATFHHLNIVPQWSTCNNKNWDDMERNVRALAKSTDHELLVWTGTSHRLIAKSTKQMYISDKYRNQQSIPNFIWKVIQDPSTEASLAIIQVNVPDLTISEVGKYVLCPDICKDTAWMEFGQWHDVTRGYIYCCTIQEFEKAFEYTVFEGKYRNILYDVAYFSNNTLT